MAITQKITNFPTPPNSSNDTPTEFNKHADAFVGHQAGVYTTEVNRWATQANTLKGDMNTIKADIDATVATIPTGTINDNKTSTTSVWSSKKTSDMLAGATIGGENQNGYWIKHADGTLVQYGEKKVTSSSEKNVLITLPVPFINNEYHVDCSRNSMSTTDLTPDPKDMYLYSSMNMNMEVHSFSNSLIWTKRTGDTAGYSKANRSWMAIGRWK